MNESVVEDAALDWFEALGYAHTSGLLIAPGEHAADHATFADVVLLARVRDVIGRLCEQFVWNNPGQTTIVLQFASQTIAKINTWLGAKNANNPNNPGQTTIILRIASKTIAKMNTWLAQKRCATVGNEAKGLSVNRGAQ